MRVAGGGRAGCGLRRRPVSSIWNWACASGERAQRSIDVKPAQVQRNIKILTGRKWLSTKLEPCILIYHVTGDSKI